MGGINVCISHVIEISISYFMHSGITLEKLIKEQPLLILKRNRIQDGKNKQTTTLPSMMAATQDVL